MLAEFNSVLIWRATAVCAVYLLRCLVDEIRYTEEVGELERTCDDLTTERNAMLVKLEGLKRRKHVEIEVREELR